MTITSLIRPVPQWTAVAIAPARRPISVILSTADGERDVTDDHSVASLRPLTLAFGRDAGETARLDFREEGRTLGNLTLTRWKSIFADADPMTLYTVVEGGHRCLPWPWRDWHAWWQDRAAGRDRAEHNFRLEPAALQHLMICYIRPRPVVLVSVAAPGHLNIFPMDLIGTIGTRVALALRSTNISIPIMRDAGRIVLSSLPAEMKTAAYALGEHHKVPLQDPAALPFGTRPSPLLGIPSVAEGLHIRELHISHSEEVGSHIFFAADILFDESRAENPQLHHISGFYDVFRRRRGIAFPRA